MPASTRGGERGYAMAALLVAMSIMAVAMTMLMPAWQTMVRREKEAELAFRGDQYARAIARYQRARGAFPPSVDVLVTEKFLRKKYKDPITNDDFQVIVVGQALPGGVGGPVGTGAVGGAQQRLPGQPATNAGTGPSTSGFNRVTREGSANAVGPVLGVVSKSTAPSLRVVNGRTKYNEWPFTPVEATPQAGAGGLRGDGAGGVGGAAGRGTGTPIPGMGGRGGNSSGARGAAGGGLQGGSGPRPAGSGMGSGLQLPNSGRR